MTRESKAEIMRNVDDVVSSRIVANNTIEYTRSNGERVIRLHQTDIVTFSSDGRTITLNDGGWQTVTTKDRMNGYSPFHISSLRGCWYIANEPWGKDCIPYYDGIQITDGKLPKPKLRVVKDQTTLAKKINKYCAEIRKLDILPQPNNGDCWYCMMREVKNNKPLGEVTKDTDHLMSHMNEKYIHGSILVNAMRHVGYTDSSIGAHYHMRLKDTFIRAVRRYLRAQFGLAR